DRTRDDSDGLYRRLCTPQRFLDGTPAPYGFGIGQPTLLGRRITSHGGGLRGWRSFRFYAPEERISLVVLFNHMAEPRAAAKQIFAGVLDVPAEGPQVDASPALAGTYVEPETGLVTRIEAAPGSKVRLHFSGRPELLDVKSEAEATSDALGLRR